MSAPRSIAPAESVSGLIERVTFFNEDNGFAVLKIKAKGHRSLITVVGTLASVSPGEWLTAEGRWIQDREFGLQFRAEQIRSTPPTTREGIEKYLGSGMVKGIGPVYARKMVEQFGERILHIIEHESARLESVEGIGPKRRQRIKEAWNEQRVVREIMVFLHSQGVGTSRAVRIYRTYGADAVQRVREDPYALARDIPGIGFKTADQIAQNVGIAPDSILRARAGLSHVLLEASGQGHCALPTEELLESAEKLLGVSTAVVEAALAKSIAAGEVVPDPVGGRELVFLPALKMAEEGIAARVLRLCRSRPNYPPIDIEKALAWYRSRSECQLSPTQEEALRQALASRILVITGGPGVGKTTLLNAILMILQVKKVRSELCAPTGRAAKRLSEATGKEARTIHRLLEIRRDSFGFARNESNPIECDLLVVDECSMVDVTLMHQLLRALPPAASLLLVGDADQLPSVGPGAVLRHLIESGSVPVARLGEVFRQSAGSRIITNAHRINNGLMPECGEKDEASDFYFVERDAPEQIADTLLDVVKRRIPERFRLDPLRDVQVLCPMNRGSLGIRELNVRLQAELNPQRGQDPFVERFGWRFRAGDKVIQTENDYDKEVFNGDIGFIDSVIPDEREVRVRFDARIVAYDFGELDELALAYAITIHKSQGSEFSAVVIPLATQQYVLLQRNLIYTAVTRGRRLVLLVGQKKALGMAIHNDRREQRYSGLRDRLHLQRTDS